MLLTKHINLFNVIFFVLFILINTNIPIHAQTKNTVEVNQNENHEHDEIIHNDVMNDVRKFTAAINQIKSCRGIFR